MEKVKATAREARDIRIDRFIDCAGLYLVGFLSLGFLLYYRSFAKLHLYFSFVGVPLFIGDAGLAICLCLFLWKYRLKLPKAGELAYVLLFYIGFVTLKTLAGYFRWGPLALRHAVMFYYPLFALFCYSFFRGDFFSRKKSLAIVLIFISVFRFFDFHPHFIFTCSVLTLILISNYPKGTTRNILYLLLLFFLPYRIIFDNSRSFITGNVAALAYICFGALVIFKIKKLYKIFLCAFFILFVVSGLLTMSSRSELKSLVGYKVLVSKYSSMVAKIRIRERDFVKETLKVKLYDEKRGVIDRGEINERIASLLTIPRENINLPEAGPSPSGEDVDSYGGADVGSGPDAAAPNGKFIAAQMRGGASEGRSEAVMSESALLSPKLCKTAKTDTVNDEDRSIDVSYGNSLFRLFVWRDALGEIAGELPVFGFSFGRPFRSHTLEVLNWASSEWKKDGWICMHNSYIDLVYRAGIIGVLMIIAILTWLFLLIRASLRGRSLTGVLLTAILINWLIAANFLEILEMPYSAIPLWSLFGMTTAYLFKGKAA